MAEMSGWPRRWAIAMLSVSLTAPTAGALPSPRSEPGQSPPNAEATEEPAAESTAAPAPETPTEESRPEPQISIEDVIVVTASRSEQKLLDAPASMTVLSDEQIAAIPADDYGDLLRNVPGLNVSQMSARDIQITGRSATFAQATSELVLLDGRSLYLDFFGFVMWDFLPVDPQDIKQIEVVRGPGSAVWGANAMSGVINLITKSPRELAGTRLQLGAGQLGTFYGGVRHAGVRGGVGYKLSASYFEQDPYPRPTGVVPGTDTPYPPFPNEGTAQPKTDLRLDWRPGGDALWSFAAGYAGTDGIIHSGIGPFDIESGSHLSYLQLDWTRRALRVSAFANFLDGDADNLLTVGTGGEPLVLAFQSQTYDLDFSSSTAFGDTQLLTYGATARTNSFDLSLAPAGKDRDEVGVFLQDEMLFGDKVRWVVGARWDDIDPIGSVISPRTTLMILPEPGHVFRISFNRAFRAPSLVNNFLDITVASQLPLPIGTFVFPSRVVGNEDLEEERLDAFELSWVGTFGRRLTASAAIYVNETRDSIDFFESRFYTAADPPPGWPLPPIALDFPPLAGALPAEFTYRNVGRLTDQGIELSLEYRAARRWSGFLTYSYQASPGVRGIPEDEVNVPPRQRLNLGASWDRGRFFVHGNLNYVDEAFWTDVLDARFHGPTDAYTQVNLAAGVRLAGESLTLSLVGSNIFDEEVQQHVFGDILERKLTGQLTLSF